MKNVVTGLVDLTSFSVALVTPSVWVTSGDSRTFATRMAAVSITTTYMLTPDIFYNVTSSVVIEYGARKRGQMSVSGEPVFICSGAPGFCLFVCSVCLFCFC